MPQNEPNKMLGLASVGVNRGDNGEEKAFSTDNYLTAAFTFLSLQGCVSPARSSAGVGNFTRGA